MNEHYPNMNTVANKPTIPNNLPQPSTDTREHSERVKKHILHQIQQHNGSISFADYMQICLYEPGLGYYSAGCEKFGPGGDFTTAPLISPLFAQCLGQQCQEVLQTLAPSNILELGAGNGKLAQDILDFLAKHQQLPDTYFILEVSAQLQQQQQKTLQKSEHIDRIKWISALPQDFNGIILANEVMDAMPVELFHLNENGNHQLVVSQKNEEFCWQLSSPRSTHLKTQIDKIAKTLPKDVRSSGYTSEFNTNLSPWIKSLASCLARGVILLIDYGFPEAEYYHPQRSTGTLMCHFQHHAHSHPLIYPGIQDITSHVDFTEVAAAATDNDLKILGYCSQGAFLLALGLLEKVNQKDFEAKQQVKRLTMPHEMGELFKVIALGKNVEQSLLGFTIQNQPQRLHSQERL